MKMLGSQYKMFDEYSNSGRPVYRRRRSSNLLLLVVIVLTLGVILTILNVYQLQRMKEDHEIHQNELAKLPVIEAQGSDHTYPAGASPIVWIEGSPKSKNNGPNGYLKHVYNVFDKMGFTVGEKLSDWVVGWIHDYPFVTLRNTMATLKPYQRINHFPGSGFITNKVSLAQTKLDFIPKAFEIPSRKKEFLEYAEKHKNISWVQKNNMHRGIKVKKTKDLDLTKGETFVQEFISRPYLIDGHKFDIGIYTIITSINPLRVYVIDGEALFRFCPLKYYPFDSTLLDKYVVGDEYLPLWNVPSLKHLHTEKGYTFKESFNEYLKTVGKDPTTLWKKVKSAIRTVILTKEPELIRSVHKYPSKRNFFELIRFDFVVDENMNVFLMEGNMSPNLSSDHFKENARLYEHVLFNLLSLVGVGHFTSTSRKKTPAFEEEMLVSPNDIQVFPDYCRTKLCLSDCNSLVCKLCSKCLTEDLRNELKLAYLEHTWRGTARRIFPPSISQEDALAWTPKSDLLVNKNLNFMNKFIYLWFVGKCRLDAGWCY